MTNRISLLLFRLLPATFRARLEHRPSLKKAFTNTCWLFFDRFLRIVFGLIVGIWVARYLGAEQYGLLNYATAFVALFSSIATLGLNGIVVRDLVRDPNTANSTLGTAFLLQLIGGLMSFCFAIYAISFAREDDSLAKLIVSILGFTLIFKATNVVKYWYESHVQSKYIVVVENSVFALFLAVKIVLILLKATLIAFVWAALWESAFVATGLLAIYTWTGGKLTAWEARLQRARTLLKDSWTLIFSGLAVMIYMRIDQIMLGQMLDDKVVGVYSVAVRLSEFWYFIPMSIVSSTFPALMKSSNQASFERDFQRLFDLMFIIALILAITITVLSEPIVNVLYGTDFEGSAPILSVYGWVLVFAFLGVPAGRWYLYANLQLLAFYRTITGALLNIILNMQLIPVYGPIGSAYATLAAILTSNILFNAFNKSTYNIFVMQVRSFSMYSFRKHGLRS